MKKNSSKYMQIILWFSHFKDLREQFRRATLQLCHKIQYTSLSDFILVFLSEAILQNSSCS